MIRYATEILMPGYLPFVSWLRFKYFNDLGASCSTTLTEIALSGIVDMTRVVAIGLLISSNTRPEIVLPAIACYVLMGVAMKNYFDSKMQSKG